MMLVHGNLCTDSRLIIWIVCLSIDLKSFTSFLHWCTYTSMNEAYLFIYYWLINGHIFSAVAWWWWWWWWFFHACHFHSSVKTDLRMNEWMNDGCRRIVAMAMVAGSDPGFQQASAAAALSICSTMSSSGRRATNRFYVEMKPGETTFVSWRKLVKDSHRDTNPNGSSPSPTPFGAHPALEARIAPEVSVHSLILG